MYHIHICFGITIKQLYLNCIIGPLQYGYPCHSQSVERTVKLVSESTLAVYGQERRHGWIKMTIQSRKQMPAFKSKKDFKQN